MSIRKLGYLPDPHKRPGDPQDRDAKESLKAQVALPRASTLRSMATIMDQGGIGSCVANSIAQAVWIAHRKQLSPQVQPKLLSRLFVYYFSRAYHHQTSEDSGTFLRLAFSALNKFGFCPDTAWVYDDGPEKFRKMPSMAAISAAYDQRSPTVYRRIYDEGNSRLLAIKTAIATGYAVCFGTDVSVAFTQGDLGSEPLPAPIGQPLAGGHAMAIVGYDGDVFEIANSWGTGFGDQGFCRFSADYIKWSGTRDLWIVEHSPLYSK